jgi:hypothetical protein
MKNIINYKSIFSLSLAILLCFSVKIFAAPPDSPYTPGETLTPGCAPGATNCTVTAPAISGTNADISTLGEILTLTNANSLTITIASQLAQISNIMEWKNNAGDTTLAIDRDGHLILVESEYGEISIPTYSLGTGANAPDKVLLSNGNLSGSLQTYGFSATTTEQLFFTVQVPHDYKGGTDLYANLYWMPTTNVSMGGEDALVEWNIEYSWNNAIGSQTIFPTSTIITADQPITYCQYGETYAANCLLQLVFEDAIFGGMVEEAPGSISGKWLGSYLIGRVYRNPDSDNDTYPEDAGLLGISFSYEMDAIGSKGVFDKSFRTINPGS